MAAKIDIDIIAHDQASGVFKSVSGSLGRIFETAAGFLTSQVFGRIADSAVDFGRSIISEAADAQVVMSQLESVLKSTGGAAGITADMANQLATSMMNLTRFDDEAAMSAETVLLQFTKIGKDVFPEALKLTADLATRMGTDLSAAAMTVGKALGDPAEGIGRLNMQFRLFNDAELKSITAMAEAGDVAGAQAIIMDRLREKIGGAAEAAGKTFAGQMDILKNQINNVKESIGEKLLPILSQFLDKITAWLAAGGADKIAEWAGTLIDWIDNLISAFQNIGSAVGSVSPFISEILGKFSAWFAENGPLIQTYLQKMGEMFARLAPIVQAVWDVISPILLGLIDTILGIVTLIMQIATGDWAGAWETLKNIVISWGQAIVGVIQGIINLVGAVITAYMGQARVVWTTIWEGMKAVVESVLGAISNFVRERVAAISNAFGGIVSAIQGVITWLGSLASAFASLVLPDWLTPGSPTPLENGLVGISKALADVTKTMPSLSMGMMNLSPSVAGAGPFERQAETIQRQSVTININGTFRVPADMDYVAQEVAKIMAR